MSEQAGTRDLAALQNDADDALRAVLGLELDESDVLCSWIALGAVRAPDGGRVTAAVSHQDMPSWEMRGILAEALALLDEPIQDAGMGDD